jgi:beta-fructofuranosidase
MNDPNGLIYWNGRYHLFYQYNPASTAHENVCWGHAVSKDLVHWDDLPLALEPTPGSVDEDGCWSGRAVAHRGQVYLLYTGYRGGRQRPCLARALDDDLVRFEKFDGNPVIAEEPSANLVGFRDCAIWQSEDGFHQLVGSGNADLGGCLLEYKSKDLVHWEYCGVFLSGESSGIPGTMWECPDIFQIGSQWFVVVSVMEGRELSRVVYVEGALDGDRFIAKDNGRVDTGSRWYAPQSFDAPVGRRVIFGWLKEREETLPADERGRRVGVMSLPRQLYVTAAGALGMAPVAELQLLRRAPLTTAGPSGDGPGTVGAVVLQSEGALDAVEVEVVCREGNRAEVSLIDGDGAVVVNVVVGSDGIHVGTAPASPSAGAVQVPSGVRGIPNTGSLRVFYDRGICEVFSPTGEARGEIFYDCRPVTGVLASWQDAEGQPIPSSSDDVRSWALADIWPQH